MNLKECMLVAIEGIFANKMRSILTMLGIIIGVAAVITVVAIGQAGQSAIVSTFEEAGTNLFGVYPKWDELSTMTPADMITLQDLEVIKNSATDIKYLSPGNNRTLHVKYGRKNKIVYAFGVWPDYNKIRNIKLAKGRFLSWADEKAARRVVVIDDKLAEDLFGRENPLLKQIDVFGTPMMVIGTVKPKENIFDGGPNQKSNIYTPFSAFCLINNSNYISDLEASAINESRTENAMAQAKQILENRHHAKNKYEAYSLKQDLDQVNKVLGIFQLVVGSIAAISLVVGGIGVMNIMLVSVTERTREIGIRKALGAQYKDIMVQFLIEAVVICSIGGAFGILLGLGGGLIVAVLAKLPPLVSPGMILIAVGFSAAIGILSGLYPANLAAKMDPVEALRHE